VRLSGHAGSSEYYILACPVLLVFGKVWPLHFLML